MQTLTMTNEAVLALADYLTKRTDLNVGGPGSPLVAAAKAVDAAAMDIINGERSASRQVMNDHGLGPSPAQAFLHVDIVKPLPPHSALDTFVVYGDEKDARDLARDYDLDRRRVHALTSCDRLRGLSGPITLVLAQRFEGRPEDAQRFMQGHTIATRMARGLENVTIGNFVMPDSALSHARTRAVGLGLAPILPETVEAWLP